MKIGIVLLVMIVFVIGAAYAGEAPANSCVAGPNEICPSILFVAEMEQWKVLNHEVQTYLQQHPSNALNPPLDQQQKRDQFSELTMRIAQQIPLFYRWDETRGKFVRLRSPRVPRHPQTGVK
jgi:predicted Abi (CAAX) family protease